MTGMDERLAKVTEVVRGHLACYDMVMNVRAEAREVSHLLAPLLAEWRAEDEARGRDQVSPARGSAYDGGYLDGQADGAERVAEAAEAALSRVRALAAEWEAAAGEPMPKRAPTESAQDQGVRIGVWHSVRVAAQELRVALNGAQS